MTVQPMQARSYGLVAVDRECAKVASTVAGRNHQLHASACSLGQLVGAGVLDRSLVEQELLGAAEACGYVAKDGIAAARSAIKSGLDRGERSPRNIQSRQGCSPSIQRVPLQPVHVETAVVEDDAERIARARYLWAQRQVLDEQLPARLSRPAWAVSRNARLATGSRRACACNDRRFRGHQ